MTSYQKPEETDERKYFKHFHHILFWVGNAKQAASYYCEKLGFRPHAYRGLETGSREIVSYVVKQNDILFVFESALLPNNKELGDHLVKHGDGVKDIAFTVDNLRALLDSIRKRDAKSIVQDFTEIKDEFGSCYVAKVQTFGDTTHTLIQLNNYKGLFLPSFKEPLNRVNRILNFEINKFLNLLSYTSKLSKLLFLSI